MAKKILENVYIINVISILLFKLAKRLKFITHMSSIWSMFFQTHLKKTLFNKKKRKSKHMHKYRRGLIKICTIIILTPIYLLVKSPRKWIFKLCISFLYLVLCKKYKGLHILKTLKKKQKIYRDLLWNMFKHSISSNLYDVLGVLRAPQINLRHAFIPSVFV